MILLCPFLHSFSQHSEDCRGKGSPCRRRILLYLLGKPVSKPSQAPTEDSTAQEPISFEGQGVFLLSSQLVTY